MEEGEGSGSYRWTRMGQTCSHNIAHLEQEERLTCCRPHEHLIKETQTHGCRRIPLMLPGMVKFVGVENSPMAAEAGRRRGGTVP